MAINMKQIHELTRLGQLRRMRQLAETALEFYDLGETRLTFLRYFANITYRVDASISPSHRMRPSPYTPNRYLLRVLLSDHWEYAKGEMTWLAALSNEADLFVPAPVPTRDGELLRHVSTPGVPAGRIVSLMRWIDGHKLAKGLRTNPYQAWGQMVGRLHAFASRWQPPVGFERFIWDWEGLLGGRGFGYSIEELITSMPRHLQKPFQIVSKEVKAGMKALGKGRDAYGMIHADMYPDNILFKDGEAFPIDFEDCGFGYWLWDIGVALEQHPWTEEWCRKRDAFLEGYIQVHALPESQLRSIDLFMAANYATGVLWASAFILDDPARKDEHEKWRNESGAKLLQYFKLR